jgi:hypothetical protein
VDSVLINSAVLIIQLIIAGFVAWVAFFRAPYQNSESAAGAIDKFQSVTIRLQEKQEKSDAKIAYLEGLLRNTNLTMTIEIQVGERPSILDYKWAAVPEGKEG